MDKKLFSFKDFINEQVTDPPQEEGPITNVPETEREAKSRIAKSIIKNLFGDNVGLTGGVDSFIEQTEEVKESLPYKGCGASEPFPLEKTTLSVMTIKILLNYLQKKFSSDPNTNYDRVIKDLEEKRAVIIGVRNKLSVKKEISNQDRFTDALYFIPGNAKDGSEQTVASDGSNFSKTKKEDIKNKSVFDRNKDIRNRKNEALVNRLNSINYIIESGIFTYDEYYKLNIEKEEIISILSETNKENGIFKDAKEAINKMSKSSNDNQNTSPESLGDKITPYQITTVPSLAYYGKKPMNPKGVGIKIPGDTLYLLQESSLGSGNKYKMMVEGQPIKVGRYPIGVTKFETYKPSDIYTENCGMQIHRSSTKGVGICVGPWSAGCQVFADYQEWQDFISKAEKEKMNSNKFHYGLIQLDDIPKEVMDAALKGIVY